MVKMSKAIPQNYLRIQDEDNKLYGCLDDSNLIPHTDKISQNTFEQLILSAIEKANKKSSREILAISLDATTYEIEQIYDKKGKALFTYFKKYCGDPAATAYQILNKNCREVGIEQFRNRTLQKERMNSGWRYQYLVIDCAIHSRRFKSISDLGAVEADFNVIIPFKDHAKEPLNLYVSVKNRSNTMGGQDWPKAIQALEIVARTDKNRTGPYCCIFGIAMEKGNRYIKYEKKTNTAYSVNTEVWLSDFFWPFFTNYSYKEVMTAVLNVLMSKYSLSPLATQLNIPERLLDSFQQCCTQAGLVNKSGYFHDPHKLVSFFCN